jgi:hypothetical protein
MNGMCPQCARFVDAPSSQAPHDDMAAAGGLTISGNVNKASTEHYDCNACGTQWSRGMDERGTGPFWLIR